MAFLLFECVIVDGENVFRSTGENYVLAGKNGLIYKAWQQQGELVNEPWHTTANELIQLHTSGTHTSLTRRLIIDFQERKKELIDLVELLDVYAFTEGDKPDVWTPLMFRFRHVYFEKCDSKITSEQKANILTKWRKPIIDGGESIEFLYLKDNWAFGSSTNAAILYGKARDYFRKFF
jgi:hypothetical protein